MKAQTLALSLILCAATLAAQPIVTSSPRLLVRALCYRTSECDVVQTIAAEVPALSESSVYGTLLS